MRISAPPLVLQTRQNHALEHATMHLLTAHWPGLRLVGRSDWNGFTLYGEVETEAVEQAVTEALARLQNHEAWLAVHPRCGTNLATTVLLAGSTTYVAALLPTRSRLAKGVAIVAAVVGALTLGQRFGLAAQRHITTTPYLEDTRVVAVHRQAQGGAVIHRVIVAHEGRSQSQR
jgi:hypothetical protein